MNVLALLAAGAVLYGPYKLAVLHPLMALSGWLRPRGLLMCRVPGRVPPSRPARVRPRGEWERDEPCPDLWTDPYPDRPERTSA